MTAAQAWSAAADLVDGVYWLAYAVAVTFGIALAVVVLLGLWSTRAPVVPAQASRLDRLDGVGR